MFNKFIKVGVVCLASFSWMNLAFSSGSHAHNHVSGVENKSVGKPSQESKARKRIKVVTSDNMRFTFPKNLTLKDGEIITFVITNEGKIPHEFSIGNEKEQKAHQLMMRKNPTMVHNDGNTITIQPGETSNLTWEFKGSGTVVFSCNIPGHFESGMYQKAKINSSI